MMGELNSQKTECTFGRYLKNIFVLFVELIPKYLITSLVYKSNQL